MKNDMPCKTMGLFFDCVLFPKAELGIWDGILKATYCHHSTQKHSLEYL